MAASMMAVGGVCKLYSHKYSFKRRLLGTTNINNFFSAVRICFRSVSETVNSKDYTDTPEYPPILDSNSKAVRARQREEYQNKIKSIKTVEEKLFAINLPKYYGWKCLTLNEGEIPYNVLPLTQFITRTHIIDGGSLPYSLEDAGLYDRLLPKIKSQIEEALVLEYNLKRKHQCSLWKSGKYLAPGEEENIIATSVIQQINRILLLNLSSDFPHLIKTSVDLQPRLEAFWSTGGIDPPSQVIKCRKGHEILKNTADEPVDRWVQYIGAPVLQVRSELPLQQNVPMQEYASTELPVPLFTYDPRVLGTKHSHRHGTNIPGFWPGDVCEYGIVSYHNMGHLLERPAHFGAKDRCESLLVQAILASYGWTLSQACYQGFSTFNDLTYPLVTQTVITNGQLWSFFSYQLNTTLLQSEHALSNPRRNICWGTDELKLFESIDNSKVNGFNDDVLKTLIGFYINKPKVREGVNMKPYLDDKEGPHIANISDIDRRIWLEDQFKYMYSNRPRHRLSYEMYDWERIYKHFNKTRPLDKKTRPFELGLKPYSRKYNEHVPPYVPKKFRPEDKRNRSKWSKTYYPL